MRHACWLASSYGWASKEGTSLGIEQAWLVIKVAETAAQER